MRTGPFSEPTVVSVINRYFVPFHMDNATWEEARYGMEPGHEDAYIMLETPDLPGVEKEVRHLKTLRQTLEPENTRAELFDFLEDHPDLYQPWPELARLEQATDASSRLERARLLLEEGRTKEAREILAGDDLPARAALLRARALRLEGDRAAAEKELAKLGGAGESELEPEIWLEKARLALDKDEPSAAAALLDRVIAKSSDAAMAAEAHYLRGWVHHLAGEDEKAIAVWTRGIESYPPTSALYSQKAYFTMIRANWKLPPNVDQPY